MTRRRRDLALAAVLVALLAAHAMTKARTGLLPEMLWACHVASLLTAIGLVARVPRLLAIGLLFHLGIGIPALALEVLATGETTVSSVALHALTPLAAFLALEELPRTAILDTWIFHLAMQPVGWLLPAALNVNLAHRPWAFLPWETGPWIHRVLNGAGAVLFLFGAFVVVRRFLARPMAAPST